MILLIFLSVTFIVLAQIIIFFFSHSSCLFYIKETIGGGVLSTEFLHLNREMQNLNLVNTDTA